MISGHIHRMMRKDPEPGINSFTLITAPPGAAIRVNVTKTRLVLIVNSIEGKEMNRIVLNSNLE